MLLATSSEGKWINRKSKKECMQFQKLFFVLELYKFLGCLECISRNGLSTAKRAIDLATPKHNKKIWKIQSGQYYGEILISSNMNSKQFCFHCVRPSVRAHINLK